jgi:hypothetical protein
MLWCYEGAMSAFAAAAALLAAVAAANDAATVLLPYLLINDDDPHVSCHWVGSCSDMAQTTSGNRTACAVQLLLLQTGRAAQLAELTFVLIPSAVCSMITCIICSFLTQ